MLEKEKSNVILVEKRNRFLSRMKKLKLSYQYDSELLSRLSNPNNEEIIYINNGNIQLECEQIYITTYGEKLACILKPVNKVEGVAADEAIAFILEENSETGAHAMFLMNDEDSQKVFDEYYNKLNEQKRITAIQGDIDEDEIKNEKRSYLVSTIVIGIIYSIILVLGILGLTKVLSEFCINTFYSSVDELLKEDIGNVASTVFGLIFMSFLPTIGYYLSFNKLYNLKKMPRILIFLGSLILSGVMVGLFMIIYNKEQEELLGMSYKIFIDELDNSSYEHILTIFVAHIGLLIAYLLSLLNIDGAKLEYAREKLRVQDSDKPKSMMLHSVLIAYSKQLIKLILRFFIRFVQLIIVLKEKSKAVYFSIMTLCFTVLCYFTSFFSIILIIGIVISLLALLVSKSFETTGLEGMLDEAFNTTSHYTYEINVNGYTRTLKYHDYRYDASHGGGMIDVYVDNVGDYWCTDDNGNTFYKDI